MTAESDGAELAKPNFRAFREIISRVVRCVPVGIWRRIFPKRTLSICYHMVSDVKVPHVKHYPILTTTELDADLSYIEKTWGFATYGQLLERRSAGTIVRDDVAVITFDDGFAECFTVVRPILLRHRAGCIFFVITDLIDNKTMFRETQASLCLDAIVAQPLDVVETLVRELGLDEKLSPNPASDTFDFTASSVDTADLGCRPDPGLLPLFNWLLNVSASDAGLMDRLCERLGIDVNAYMRKVSPYLSRDQIQQLHSEGFTIGAHSCSHRFLQGLSQAEVEHEIVESCRIIRDLTGQSSVPFAFPYSGAGIDRAWLAQLRQQHDYIGLFFDTGGLCRDVPFVVQRVFGERIQREGSIDDILRRAWARRTAWHRGD